MDWIDYLDKRVIEEKTKRDEERAKTYPEFCHHPSQSSALVDGKLHGKCLRASFYQWTKVPKSNPIDAGGIWKQNIGDMIHERIQGIFLSGPFEGIEKEKRVDIKNPALEYPIIGSIDLYSEKLKMGLEIKTTYGAGMTSPFGIKALGPKMEHRLQAICYMAMTGINQWFYIYFARDNAYRCQLAEEWNEKCQELWKGIIERWKALEAFLKINELPPRDYKVILNEKGEMQDTAQRGKEKFRSDWQCSYCDWKAHCWKDAKPEEGKKI